MAARMNVPRPRRRRKPDGLGKTKDIRPRRASPSQAARSRGKQARSSPRRGLQLLVWALVLGVFCGLAQLSGEGFGSVHHHAAPPTAAAASSTTVPKIAGPEASSARASGPKVSSPEATAASLPAAGANHLYAAPRLPAGIPGDASTSNDKCKQFDEQSDYLPLHRWTSFSLFVVDNAHFIKTRLFMTMIASLMLMAGALVWRLIGMLMGFSYTFDMVCLAAGPVNKASGMLAGYAGWFMIPAWLFVLAAAVKRWSSGRKHGPADGIRLVMVFLTATGLIFFIGEQSGAHEATPTDRYTVPWLAMTVENWFGIAGESLPNLWDLQPQNSNQSADVSGAFYDSKPSAKVGKATCVALDQALYGLYKGDNANTSLGNDPQTGQHFNGVGAMTQVSQIWEIAYVRSWMAAQFGDGSPDYPSPSHSACRMLEAHSNVPVEKKWKAFATSIGQPNLDLSGRWLGMYISPPSDSDQTVMIAWGACESNADGVSSNGTLEQWDKASGLSNKAATCGKLYSMNKMGGVKDILRQIFAGQGDLSEFYFNGSDEMDNALGDCMGTPECRADWAYVGGWLGSNEAERITQGLMAMIVAIVFLFVLGPMAIGLMLISVALAILAMLLPLSLIFFAIGKDQGKKLLKLTGAAAAGKFLFTLALSALMVFIAVTYSAILAAIGNDSPNFFEQILEAGAPLIGLFIFKKIGKIMGMGDITSMSGALGFAGAAALKATGDRDLSRHADRRMQRNPIMSLSRLGVGNARLGALDERSLQRRMLNNQATRSMAAAVGRGARRAARPATGYARARGRQARAFAVRSAHAVQRGVLRGTPGQRAAAYTGLTAALAGLTAVAPPTVLGTLPLMAAAAAAAAGRGGQAGLGRLRRSPSADLDGRYDSGAAPGQKRSGIPLANGTRAERGLREEADWHRNITRVHNQEERRRLEAEHTEAALTKLVARTWGVGRPGGLNLQFEGFANDDEKMQALHDLSKDSGIPMERLLIGNHGLAVPVPVMRDRKGRGRHQFAPGTSMEEALHPVHWLDHETKQRRVINGVRESDDEYVVRLTGQLRARGYVTNDGEIIDVATANGYDILDRKVRERFATYVSGGRDEELSHIVVASRRPETVAVNIAHEWGERRSPSVRIQQERDAVAVADLIRSAEREVGDFSQIEVQLASGTSATAGQVKADLDDGIAELRRANTRLQGLYLARERGEADETRLEQDMDDLMDEIRSYARKIDHLSMSLRDAFEVAPAARSVAELQIKLLDPNVAMDSSEVAWAAEKATEDLKTHLRELTDALDRQIGGFYQAPTTLQEAQDLARALTEYQKMINDRVDAEDANGRQVIDRLNEIRRLVEGRRDMASRDPHRSGPHTPDVYQLLQEQYERR